MEQQIIAFLEKNGAIVLPIIGLWAIVWKAFALWKAAKKDHKVFFALILVLNTLGLFEILYLYLLSKVNYAKLKTKISGIFNKTKK